MRKLVYLLLGVAFVSTGSYAQGKKPLSPKETVNGTVGGASVEIVYCRPSARDRKVMGALVPYGEVWRTGANAATTIEFSKDVKIEGKDLPAGKYELFTIPGENEWIIIFQKFGNQWGHFSYKEANDVLRVKVKPSKTDSFVETFTIAVVKNEVSLKWENTMVAFKIKG